MGRAAARIDPVVVIGSGITGLCTASLLAEQGHEIHVIEAHPRLVGGHARSFERDGFRFCAGPQYLWHFQGNGIGARVMRFLGLDGEVLFDPMDPNGFERIIVDGNGPVHLPMGLDRLRASMAGRFPAEVKRISGLIDDIRRIGEVAHVLWAKGLYRESGLRMALAAILSPHASLHAKLTVMRHATLSIASLFDRHGLSPASRALLYGHGGIFAENAATLSAIVYGAATAFYHEGATYPRHGFRSLIDALRRKIESRGGTVECDKRAVKLDVSGGRATRVHCADGSSYAAGTVVSNLSPRLTCALLGGPLAAWRFSYAPSNTLVGCYVGVSGYPEMEKAIGRRNVWWYASDADCNYDTPDMTAPPRMLYIAAPSTNGAGNRNPNPDDHSLIVFAPGSFDVASRAYHRSPQAHAELREQAGQQVLTVLSERVFPGLRSHVKVFRVLTPWDLHEELSCEAGNVYGRRMDARAMLRGTGPMPPIGNLHLACATVGLAGIATGCQTAAHLAEKLTGVRI